MPWEKSDEGITAVCFGNCWVLTREVDLDSGENTTVTWIATFDLKNGTQLVLELYACTMGDGGGMRKTNITKCKEFDYDVQRNKNSSIDFNGQSNSHATWEVSDGNTSFNHATYSEGCSIAVKVAGIELGQALAKDMLWVSERALP